MLKKILATFIITVSSMPMALAEGESTGSGVGGGGSTGSRIDSPEGVITALQKIADWMLTVFMVLAVIFILLAAFKYLTSKGGDGVKDAHKMILYAVVAVAVAILAPGIVNLVEAFLK